MQKTTPKLWGLTTLVLWSVSRTLSQTPASLPESLGDYAAYLRALDHSSRGQFEPVLVELNKIWDFQPSSPLLGQAAMLAARAHLELGQPSACLSTLRKHVSSLPQPAGVASLAKCADFAGQLAASAAYYQRVYYTYPRSPEAAEAEQALERLRTRLGSGFPPPTATALLDRAAKLRSPQEYSRIVPLLGGRDRERATVRARPKDLAFLEDLAVSDRDVDAERLFRIHNAAREAGQDARAEAAVRELGREHLASPWRLDALLSLGNMYLLRNKADKYVPVFTDCYTDFTGHARAAYCHWKVVWASILQRSENSPKLLADHLTLFPASEKRSAALYFTRRYAEILRNHPQSYYAVLARPKLGQMQSKADRVDFSPSPGLKQRIRRARLLVDSGLTEWAEVELKYAARQEASPYAAVSELAGLAARRLEHHQGIRYIKSLAPGYLSMPLDAAPRQFWQLAFPLAYRQPLETYSRNQGLDPFLVAALIRQESEFDPKAVSSARAYGLTQVLPSTGRQLGRRLGLSAITPSMLTNPEINLKLGTAYLRTLLDQHGGRWERTLAAYNAGKTRVDQWETWGQFREPAEFIETIPFTETRDYVQIVLRNADIYRHIYDSN